MSYSVERSRQSSNEMQRVYFHLPVAVTPEVAPKMTVLVYHVLPSGETVADSTTIRVQQCFRNKVHIIVNYILDLAPFMMSEVFLMTRIHLFITYMYFVLVRSCLPGENHNLLLMAWKIKGVCPSFLRVVFLEYDGYEFY